MAIETTYTQARAQLAAYFDQATDDREIIIVRRRGARDVAIIAADELESIMETAHLLSSPRNAQRLLTALNRALGDEGSAQTLLRLRQEVGLDGPEANSEIDAAKGT